MKFYRYEYTGPDTTGRIDVVLRTARMVKETPKGYWILDGLKGKKHWVSKTAKKRYAYPTKKEALESFYHRCRRWVELSEYNLKKARSVFYEAAAWMNDEMQKDYQDAKE